MHRVSQASTQNPISCFRAWAMMLSSGCQAVSDPGPTWTPAFHHRLTEAKLAGGALQPLPAGAELCLAPVLPRKTQAERGWVLYQTEWFKELPLLTRLQLARVWNLLWQTTLTWVRCQQARLKSWLCQSLNFIISNTEFSLCELHPPPL